MKQKRIGFIIVPLVLFVLLAICIQAGITVGFEGWAYSETAEEISPFMTTFMKAATYIGESYVVISFCLLLFVISKSRKSIALPVSAAVIVSGILNFVLKEIFTRQRPDILRLINETGYSFPSGHAMINASLYTMLILMIFKFVPNTARKLILSAFCAAAAIVIGISRIYLGVHYAGDVIGGWLIGFAISAFLYSIWNGEKIQKIYQLFVKKRNT